MKEKKRRKKSWLRNKVGGERERGKKEEKRTKVKTRKN